jgi:hypothetical protein
LAVGRVLRRGVTPTIAAPCRRPRSTTAWCLVASSRLGTRSHASHGARPPCWRSGRHYAAAYAPAAPSSGPRSAHPSRGLPAIAVHGAARPPDRGARVGRADSSEASTAASAGGDVRAAGALRGLNICAGLGQCAGRAGGSQRGRAPARAGRCAGEAGLSRHARHLEPSGIQRMLGQAASSSCSPSPAYVRVSEACRDFPSARACRRV